MSDNPTTHTSSSPDGSTGSPDDSGLLQQAVSYLDDLNRPEDAIRLTGQYLLKHPDNAYAHYLLGFAQNRAGQYEQALATMQRYLVLEPDDPDAYGQISDAYEGLDRWDEAIEAATKYIELAPDSEQAHFYAASLAYNLARAAESPETKQNIAEAKRQWQAKRQARLTSDGDELDSDRPTDGSKLHSIALTNRKFALQEINRSLEIRPEKTSSLLLRGGILLDLATEHEFWFSRRGPLKRARADFQAVLAVEPANQRALRGIAEVDQAQGRTGQALISYAHLLRLDPSLTTARQNMWRVIHRIFVSLQFLCFLFVAEVGGVVSWLHTGSPVSIIISLLLLGRGYWLIFQALPGTRYILSFLRGQKRGSIFWALTTLLAFHLAVVGQFLPFFPHAADNGWASNNGSSLTVIALFLAILASQFSKGVKAGMGKDQSTTGRAASGRAGSGVSDDRANGGGVDTEGGTTDRQSAQAYIADLPQTRQSERKRSRLAGGILTLIPVLILAILISSFIAGLMAGPSTTPPADKTGSGQVQDLPSSHLNWKQLNDIPKSLGKSSE